MFRPVRRVAWEEVKCFFLNSKMILIVFEIIFFCETYLVKIKEYSEYAQMKLSFFEPYLLVCSSGMYFLAIPLIYMILLSGFPSRRSYNYFSLIRISRIQWLLGELLFLLISAVGYILIIGISMMAYMGGHIAFTNEWSSYMLEFRKTYPDMFLGNEDRFLDVAMMTHGSPMSVFVHSVLLMLCMLFVVALVQIVFSLLQKKYAGMILMLVMFLSSALASFGEGKWKWIFPMTHTSFAAHFNGFRAEQNMSIGASYLYYIVLLLFFLVISLYIVRKVNMEAGDGM